MAVNVLNDPQSCNDFLRQATLISLQGWREFPALQNLDVTTLDKERDGMLHTISVAFRIDEAWEPLRQLLVALSPYMERRGHWELWYWILNQAIELAQRLDDLSGASELSLLLAKLRQRQGDVQATVAAYRQTMRLASKINDAETKARACSNLGYLYVEQGHWWRAETLCCNALKTFKQLDKDYGQAHTENHLGILYTRQQRWEAAKRHLERACLIWDKKGDNHGLMRGYINLSLLYIDMKQPHKVLKYSEDALVHARISGEEAEIGTIYMNIAAAYYLDHKFGKAKSYVWKAESIFKQFLNLAGLVWVKSTLGMIYQDQGNWSEAKHYLEAALYGWRDLKNDYWEIMSLIDLIDYELARKNWLQANQWLVQVKQCLADSGKNVKNPYWVSLLKKYQNFLDQKIDQTPEATISSEV